jgi:Polysaccharide biosynthesis protein
MAASAMLMILSKVISHGCFLLVVVVLARFLDRADFGTFNQVWHVNKSLLYLFSIGLPVSVYYFLPRLSDSKIKSFTLQTMLTLSLLALPFSASMYLLAAALAVHFQNPGLAYYLNGTFYKGQCLSFTKCRPVIQFETYELFSADMRYFSLAEDLNYLICYLGPIGRLRPIDPNRPGDFRELYDYYLVPVEKKDTLVHTISSSA